MSSFAFLNLESLNARATAGPAGGTTHQHRLVSQQPAASSHSTVPAGGNPSSRRSTRRRASRVAPARAMAAAVAAPPMLPDLDEMDWQKGVQAMRHVGNEHYARADYASAIDAYLRALDVVHANVPYSAPEDVVGARVLLHNNMAAAFLELGMFNLALREAEAVCELEDGNVKALLRRGKALYGMGDVVTAELMFRRVLEVATAGYSAERADAQGYLATIARSGAAATRISEVATSEGSAAMDEA